MTFKELFTQFSFAEMSPAFLNLWQTNEPKLVEHLDWGKWERIYQNVQALEAKSSQYYIRLVWRWETCRRLAVGNHLLWRDGRDGTKEYGKNISWRDGMKREQIVMFILIWIISAITLLHLFASEAMVCKDDDG